MSKVCRKMAVLKCAVVPQFAKTSWHVQIPIHISKMVLSTVKSGPSEKGRTTHMRQIRQSQLSVPLILLAGTQIDRPRVAQFSVAIMSFV